MTDSAKLPAAVAAALGALTLALDEAGGDLTESLAALAQAGLLAVPSYSGLTVYATIDGRELGFTTFDNHDIAPLIGTSLRFAMNPVPYLFAEADAFPAIVLILYASTPGAFVDLAADMAWLLAGEAHEIVVDQDLIPRTFRRPDIAIAEMSSIDQAIGVLIGRGNTPDQARTELSELCRVTGRSLLAEAQALLASLNADAPGIDDLLD